MLLKSTRITISIVGTLIIDLSLCETRIIGRDLTQDIGASLPYIAISRKGPYTSFAMLEVFQNGQGDCSVLLQGGGTAGAQAARSV